MRYKERGVLKNERLYYLCDSRSVVGNCLQFWRKGSAGYTYNLDDCEVYPESVAFSMHKLRESDYPMPKDVVDSLAERHLDHQDFDHYLETWRSVVAQKKAEESQPLPTTQVKSSADATTEQICHCREGAAWASHLVNHKKLHWTYCPNCGKLLLT